MRAIATRVIRNFATGSCERKGHAIRCEASDSEFCEADGFGIDAAIIYGVVVIYYGYGEDSRWLNCIFDMEQWEAQRR